MTERIKRETVDPLPVAETLPGFLREAAADRNVTADLVDRAVEETFREAGVSPDVARVMRSLMGSDSGSAVARAYYHGVAAGVTPGVLAGLRRTELEVPYVLTDVQANSLADYAPDCSLRFTARESHDHPLAAACRSIDRALVNSRLPPGALVSHVGGAIVPLVSSGMLGRGHHSCSPLIDRKDPSRHVLVNLRVRKMAADTTRRAEVRDAARGYLSRSLSHVCDQRVQDCGFSTPVLTSVHVYDVQMQDWAAIMDNKNAHLVEGCILFPRALFNEGSGEMAATGARYEVDASANLFRMGFVDSPAWWYEHQLSDYLKYGVDQILSNGEATYSYKVVERRGDTLFFRILRVSRTTLPEYLQHFRVPGVQMVRVNGFSVDRPGHGFATWARRAYLFPQPLWEDMLGHAKEMVERNVLSHEKLFNYYRTVAPRQSINAVVVAGGASVDDLTHLVPLVVHVALFAFLEVRKTQVETRVITDSVMADRVREREWTLYKCLAAFGQSLVSALQLTIAPLAWTVKKLNIGIDLLNEARAFDWELVPVVQQVSSKLVLSSCFSLEPDVVAGFSEEYALAAPAGMVGAAAADASTASFVLEAFGEDLPPAFRGALGKVVEAAKQPGEVEGKSGVAVEVELSHPGTVRTVEVSEAEVQRRRLAIREAIEECEAEATKSEAACADHYRELVVGGAPNVKKLISRREMFMNPEFWRVSAGIIEGSLSGAPVKGFQHAAVFCPTPVDGSRLLAVVEDEFKGLSSGEYVERVYYKIPNSAYSGWVYTNDSLLIFNGPAVSAAMETALTLPLDFYVTLNQGPPGCGKTTAIVELAGPGDVVLVPVRKAAKETAGRLQGKKGFTEAGIKMRVRTVDSYLVNRLRTRALRELHADRLLADEAFMTREGRWYAAAAHLHVTEVQAYGDKEQIPHVPRAECPKQYVSILPQEEVATFVSHRCPPELVACWGGVYNWRVRSSSKVKGEVGQVSDTVGRTIPTGCVMMGAYQADKKLLKEKYANCGVPIQVMTIHESEGNTYEHVWLHRFDMRRRSDRFSLYDREPYVLVAMSRSTRSFLYVAPKLGDVVQCWLEKGKDSRRIRAATDVATAGQSVEKL